MGRNFRDPNFKVFRKKMIAKILEMFAIDNNNIMTLNAQYHKDVNQHFDFIFTSFISTLLMTGIL